MKGILLGLCLLAAGCASADPYFVQCKGKGTIAGQSGLMIYSAQFSLSADCGDQGFEYERRSRRPREPKTP